jgi:hypothetical protein
VVKQGVSYSGKYKFYFGHHYVQGRICFDVGTIRQTDGEIVTRHYDETKDFGATQAKAEALRVYHEVEQGMKEKPQYEEKDENNPFVADAFRRALKDKSN